jgi:hypothetical protein
MDQRQTVWFLHLQGLGATRIHQELEELFAPNTIPYSMATRICRSAIWTVTDWETVHSKIDHVIAQALGEVPFASMKEFAGRLCSAPSIGYRHLIESLSFLSKHLQWVPHDLTTAKKVLQVENPSKLR